MHLKRLCLVGFLVATGFVLQTQTPLRLNPDVVVLLSLVISGLETGEFIFEGVKTHFPLGYPYLVAVLTKIGIANSASFVVINLFGVATGLFFTYFFLRRHLRLPVAATWIVLLGAGSSYVYIKHITLAVSDSLFFGFYTGSLYLMLRAQQGEGKSSRTFWAISAVACALVATQIRSAGVSLLPGLVWVILQINLAEIRSVIKSHPLALSAVGILSGILSIIFLLREENQLYAMEMANVYADGGGMLFSMMKYIYIHITELGELFINAPASKLHFIPMWGFFIFGFLFLLLISYAIWLFRAHPSAYELVTVSYIIMIMVWPYADARFWLPSIPLFFGYAYYSVNKMVVTASRIWLFRIYVASYAIFSVIAFGYSTRITYAGNYFPQVYARGAYLGAYQNAENPDYEPSAGDHAERVLRYFSSRAPDER